MYQQKNLLVGKYVPEDKAVLKEKGIKYEVLFDCQPSADVSILAVLEGSSLAPHMSAFDPKRTLCS